MKSPSRLIRSIMENPDVCDSGKIQNDLLREFHRGYPVENLRCLLSHRNDKTVKTGIFIASELGSKARPLLEDVVRLLRHSAMVVRYDAIDSLLTCTTGEDEDEIAAVVSSLYDTEGAVRRKVMDFLARASEMQLQGGLRFFERAKPDSVHVLGLGRLIGDSKLDANEAVSFMRSEDNVLRKYGVVAAARMYSLKADPLVFGSSSNDEDVCCFANNVLELRKV